MSGSSSTGLAAANPQQAAQFLTFQLADGTYGMDIAKVREIIQYGAMTTVPLMPAFVRGVINLRGAVVPVIDLKERLGKGPAKVTKKTCIIIFDTVSDGERVELGLMVDAVSAVIEIPADVIEQPPTFGSSIRRDFIHGIGKIDGRFIILLDPNRALDMEEMATLVAETQTESHE